MKQLLQSYRSGEIWLADVPAPAVQPHGVVVRTAASVISAGTERMITELAQRSLLGKAVSRPDLVRQVIRKVRVGGFAQTMAKVFAKLNTPIPLGYSCSGVVTQVGSAVRGFSVGDRVACAGSGYATHAELNYVPATLCVRVPAEVSLEEAAFAGVGAVAVNALRLAEVSLGERVAVIGLGLIGLLTGQLLKAAGCGVLGCDIDPVRCRVARELEFDRVAQGAEILTAAATYTGGHGVDATIVTAASSAAEPLVWAGEVCRLRGKVVVVGMVDMRVPRDVYYSRELELRVSRSYGPGRYDPEYEERGRDYPYGYVRWTEQRNMEAFLDAVRRRAVTPLKLAGRTLVIDEAPEAYRLLFEEKQREKRPITVLIEYPWRAAEREAERVIELRPRAVRGEIGVGVIGAGNFARGVLLPRLSRARGVHLVGICSARGASAEEAARRFGFDYAATDVSHLLADDAVQAVLIATRHDSHARLAIEALKAGKHVLVEKPPVISARELEELLQCLEQIGRGPAVYGSPGSPGEGPVFMVGYNRRFSPHAVRVREFFADRSRPLLIAYRVNAGELPADSWIRDPEVGGGRIIGEVCHFVDYCRFVTGAAVTAVAAERPRSTTAQPAVEDSVTVQLLHEDGSVSSVVYCCIGAADLPKERIEIHGEGRSAVTEDFRSTRFHGRSFAPVHGSPDKGHGAELEAFLAAVRGAAAPPMSIEEIANVSRATFAIVDSLQTGQVRRLKG